MESLPLSCECGKEEEEKRNKEYMDDETLCEFDLYCKKCGKYLGHFQYGGWEY